MTRTAYDLQSEGFGPGANGPLLLVAAELPRLAAATGWSLSSGWRTPPAATANVAFVSPPQRSPDGRAALLIVAAAQHAAGGLDRRPRRTGCATTSCRPRWPAPVRALTSAG